MRQLMQAYWYEARKSGLFLLAIGAAAVFGALLALTILSHTAGEPFVGPDVPGEYLQTVAFIVAVLCGISSERDFSRGAVRNKIPTGHTRTEIFWSSYIVNTLIAYAAAGLYLAIALSPCIARDVLADPGATAFNILSALPAVAGYTAMFSLVGILWPYKGIAVVNLVLLLALLLTSNSLFNELQQGELYTPVTYVYVEGYGEVEATGAPIPNPHYVTEPLRSVYSFLNSFLPTGQTIQLAADEVSQNLSLYSAGFCAVCWTVGILMLSRRNLQ